jgi:hypothetical protein
MTDFVVAEAAVRQLHAHYTDAVWRKDHVAFGDCFTEDCEWRISGMILRGRAEITQFMKDAFPRYRFILINLRTPVLQVGDGRAWGRTYMSEQSMFADGRPYGPIGVYYEHFLEQSDRWRFSWRLFHTSYSGPPDLSGSFFENADFGPAPAMPPRDAMSPDHTGILRKGRS